jgi:hypothetical protein
MYFLRDGFLTVNFKVFFNGRTWPLLVLYLVNRSSTKSWCNLFVTKIVCFCYVIILDWRKNLGVDWTLALTAWLGHDSLQFHRANSNIIQCKQWFYSDALSRGIIGGLHHISDVHANFMLHCTLWSASDWTYNWTLWHIGLWSELRLTTGHASVTLLRRNSIRTFHIIEKNRTFQSIIAYVFINQSRVSLTQSSSHHGNDLGMDGYTVFGLM